jgi:hypothetical protein
VRHQPGPRHEAHCATVQQLLDALAARGVRVWAVTMSDDMSLETAPPDAMRAAGWVRAEDMRRRVNIARDDCARYLELLIDSHESERVPLDAGTLRRAAEQLRGGIQ